MLTKTALSPFHLAFPVRDLAEARHFYGEVLGCSEGRSSASWIDFNFYGHQIVAHLSDAPAADSATSSVDGKRVPLRHFGAILPLPEWQALASRLTGAGVDFLIEPQIRFRGKPGEQATMFFLDPSANAIEIKSFSDMGSIFEKQ